MASYFVHYANRNDTKKPELRYLRMQERQNSNNTIWIVKFCNFREILHKSWFLMKVRLIWGSNCNSRTSQVLWSELKRTAIWTLLVLLFPFTPKHCRKITHLWSLSNQTMQYFFLYHGAPSPACCYHTLQNTVVYFKHQQVQFIAWISSCLSWSCYS